MTSWSKYGEKNGKAGKAPFGFLDTSALIPLCVRQGTTSRAIALYKNCGTVIWWTTPVEIVIALARLVRMKQLNSSDWAKTSKLANTLGDAWSVIQPSDAVRAKAMKLVDRQDPPEMIVDMIRKWGEGYPVVICVKATSEEHGLMFWIRRQYYRLVNRLGS